MSTVNDLMTIDWWGPCLPSGLLEAAWALESKDIRLPRVCSEEPTRNFEELAELFGRPLTAQERAGASYAYCREMKIDNCHFKVPEPEVVPLSSTVLFLLSALILGWTLRACLAEKR